MTLLFGYVTQAWWSAWFCRPTQLRPAVSAGWEHVWRLRGGGSSRILPPTIQAGPPFLSSPLGPSVWAAGSLWLVLRAAASHPSLPPLLLHPKQLRLGVCTPGVPLGQGGGWERSQRRLVSGAGRPPFPTSCRASSERVGPLDVLLPSTWGFLLWPLP